MLNYGVIGCGAVFEVFQVNALLQTSGLNLLSVCDINQERLSKIQRKYNIPRGYTDYHELLQDKDIDVVMINLPQHLHREIALKSAQAGKHIYVEKPIATTLKDARDIIEVCREKGVKLCVGHQRRFITTEIKAKEMLERGELGKVFKVRAVACWFEQRENLLAKDWWYRKECGGGPMMRWGVHKTDTLHFLLEKKPLQVYAEMGQFVHRGEEITVEDNLVALYRFEGDIIGELEVSNSQHEWGFRGEYIEIFGDKGTLRYWPSEGIMEVYIPGKKAPLPGCAEKIEITPDGKEMVRIHELFIKSIEENTSPPVTGEDGYIALEMALGAYHSAEKGEVVKFPLKEEV
ncbi:Gfo/Idh/MocA family oxidoreductase [Candidatus Calescamantes bacterium]|nr:Gfo/Idh/MocA family oxidoreductase [Candidatus Calescamantes bacterium]